jgi:transposase
MNDDATSLTELLCDYGALWEISRSGRGFTARRRRPPAPPVAFAAPSVAALRPLLEHGYDPAELAAISHMFGSDWLAGGLPRGRPHPGDRGGRPRRAAREA